MSEVTWELQADRATLLCGPLRAVINLRRPSRGLHDLSVDQRQFAGCEFLGVAIDAVRPHAVVDCYTRAGDLIVRYPQTDGRPFAVGVDWRTGLIHIGSIVCPYVDLVVSVETSLLDTRPELEARTSLATPENVTWSSSGHTCLAQFPGLGLSYIEMIHPDDVLAPLLAETPGEVRLSTPLFGRPLEKGVILRSRLRGMFVPLTHDEVIKADAFAQFAATPPPLTA
ncbi:MAG TPA: hypothetical protein VG826_32690 [Pirellulales bacterium]|nr:hypothetical protein [Pirellulales bacterium]